MSEQLNDTPTHRWHIQQAKLEQIKAELVEIRTRRASVVEKLTKAKANSKVERAVQLDKSIKRLFTKLERMALALNEDIEALEDEMNKARGMILEASDGQVALPKSGPDNA